MDVGVRCDLVSFRLTITWGYIVFDPRAVNSLVSFSNSQGVEVRGTLLKLTRTTLIFEVYNPYSIIQLSEVLQDVQIRRGDNLIYRGRAVVTNLVNTGLMLIVSTVLLDPWSDLVSALVEGEAVIDEVENFLAEWEEAYQLRPGYQVSVSRLRSLMTEIYRWLGQVDLVPEQTATDSAQEFSNEQFQKLAEPILKRLGELFAEFEYEASEVPAEEVVNHKRFAQHDLHPLMLSAPFVHRSFYKPLGYAGDYEMVNMMLRDPREGPTAYAQIVNTLYLSAGPAAAHRNRIEILVDRLHKNASKAAEEGKTLSVLNVGCGPAIELQRFFRLDPLAERCRFELMDFNGETIEYTRNRLDSAMADGTRPMGVQLVHKSVHELLKQAVRRDTGELSGQYDFVYCAGLFDYLSDRVCSRLLKLFYRWVKPGGVVLATNVHPSNPIRFAMEHLAEWYLIYRDEEQMETLVPEMEHKRIWEDETGVNIFLEMTKPAWQS